MASMALGLLGWADGCGFVYSLLMGAIDVSFCNMMCALCRMNLNGYSVMVFYPDLSVSCDRSDSKFCLVQSYLPQVLETGIWNRFLSNLKQVR